ncbi:MFS transporter [Sinomonas sp. JGH33]|uniref:MFS transporter n=1 Tax=Sinomonas terricola TaxID=3110330 RepID=A0ABU5T7B6_9MICC|nr:MFS transporter [Sinomonas sp. JGH33]MEA5455563.1 MFS transporter [Sinomonas sp. JGH33]
MSEQTPLVGQRGSGGPFVTLVTGTEGPRQRAPRSVVYSMALAQFGLFVALLAPVTVSLALKVQTLMPAADAAAATGGVLSAAAFVALLANPVIGRLSDLTLSRWGRRRPWMFGGAVGFVVALAIVALAPSVPVVLAGWALAQLTGNMILAPLLTTIADQVPEEQRASVSANVGVMQNLGILAAAYVASWFVSNMLLLFVLPAAFAFLTVALYCFVLPDKPITKRPATGGWKVFVMTFWVNPLKHPDFAWVWISRFLVVLAMFLFITFRLFFLQKEVHLETGPAVQALTTGVLINTIALVVFAKIGGWLSDRTSNRKGFVIAATAVFALGTALLAVTHDIGMFYVVEAVMGIGYGVYTAVDTALVVDVLPNPDDSAKDLGVLNIANALPQSLAGSVGAILLAMGGGTENYSALFWGAGIVAFLGAVTILPVRSVTRRHAEGHN